MIYKITDYFKLNFNIRIKCFYSLKINNLVVIFLFWNDNGKLMFYQFTILFKVIIYYKLEGGLIMYLIKIVQYDFLLKGSLT